MLYLLCNTVVWLIILFVQQSVEERENVIPIGGLFKLHPQVQVPFRFQAFLLIQYCQTLFEEYHGLKKSSTKKQLALNLSVVCCFFTEVQFEATTYNYRAVSAVQGALTEASASFDEETTLERHKQISDGMFSQAECCVRECYGTFAVRSDC